MRHFSSIMFSLLVITGLQESVESAGIRFQRSVNRHFRTELSVPNGAGWGTWGNREMCPDGTYAAGFSLKVEAPLIIGDDTSLNGIRLHCRHTSNSPHNYATVHSDVGSWGRWTQIKWCTSGFLTAFQLRVERHQGHDDDTAANNIIFKCSEGYIFGEGTGWGDWGGWSQTCEGKGICGIQTRVEGPQDTGDDTALNDVRMFCCD